MNITKKHLWNELLSEIQYGYIYGVNKLELEFLEGNEITIKGGDQPKNKLLVELINSEESIHKAIDEICENINFNKYNDDILINIYKLIPYLVFGVDKLIENSKEESNECKKEAEIWLNFLSNYNNSDYIAKNHILNLINNLFPFKREQNSTKIASFQQVRYVDDKKLLNLIDFYKAQLNLHSGIGLGGKFDQIRWQLCQLIALLDEAVNAKKRNDIIAQLFTKFNFECYDDYKIINPKNMGKEDFDYKRIKQQISDFCNTKISRELIKNNKLNIKFDYVN